MKLFSQKNSWHWVANKLVSRKIRENTLNNLFWSWFHVKFMKIAVFEDNYCLDIVHCIFLTFFTEKAACNPFQELFAKFCSSSTIHGTYFCIASGSALSRCVWGLIVCLGIVSAGWIIHSSFDAWQKHPVITSVRQVSIEEIHFPAVTVCPLDDAR